MITLRFEYITDEAGVNRAYLYLANKRYLGIDTETTGLDPHSCKIHCLQIGDANKQFIFDFVRTKQYLDKILSLLTSDNIIWVGQNLKYDYQVLKSNVGITPKHMIDTMLSEQILTNGRVNISASLDALCKKYLGLEMQKDVRSSFIDHSYGTELSSVQQQYAALDVACLIPIITEQYKLLKGRGLLNVFSLESEAIKPTAELEYNGIFLDPARWRALYSGAAKDAEAAKLRLDSYFIDYCPKNIFQEPIINYNSPAQLLPILQKITNLPLTSTSKADLEKLAGSNIVIKTLLEYREAIKAKTTYGEEFLKNINRVTGRIHSSYNQLRSEGGRYSSSDPNMQNIPAKFAYRAAFRPYDITKTIMYTADYSGCELRLLAELSQDKKFRDIFISDLDPHKAVAHYLTGKKYDDITDEERKPYKSINFGVIYGRGPKNLSEDLGINIQEAKDLINNYFKTFPGVKDFLDSMASDVVRNRYAISPLDGRIRDLSSLDWDDKRMVAHAKNIAKNMPFQGGNAAMIKKAMVMLSDKIEKLNRSDLLLVACVHDEFVVEGDKDKIDEGKQIILDAMIGAGEHYVKSVPMKVGLKADEHWVK